MRLENPQEYLALTMENILLYILSISANIVAHYICKWLDKIIK